MYTLTARTGSTLIDLYPCTEKVEIITQRFDAPGKMTFSTVEDSGVIVPNGSAVRFLDGEGGSFYGFVFTAKRERNRKVSYTAYDQIRYLKAKASYTFENVPLEGIVRKIAAYFGLNVGTLATTGYSFPCLIKENESCMDIIFDALTQTIVQTGRIFNFYDAGGALMLTEAKDMYSNILIGDGSLLTNYTYKQDIDSATYNRIKLVRPNKETGRADVYEVEDSSTQAKWGLLQYYDKVDENMNAAQIAQMCERYLQYYNREIKTVTIKSMGISGFRAGMILPVQIKAVDDLSVNRLLLAEKVKHSYEKDAHTMSIEVKDFQGFGGLQIA